MAEPAIVVAAAAGLASFLSPCMLPVVPAFLAHLGGVTLDGPPRRRPLFVHATLFVAGFALAFATLGVALETAFDGLTGPTLTWLSRAAGVLIVAFGLHVTDVVEIRPLQREYDPAPVDGDGGRLSSLALGGAFAVAWTPCVGPLLGSVFTLAASRPTAAFPLLSAYAAGLGAPFLLVALVPRRTQGWVARNGATVARVHRASGVALLALGVLVFTERLALLSDLPRYVP